MKPTLSILIPVHQGAEKFKQCLQSVRDYAPLGTELIVVADGDTGQDADLARSHGALVVTTKTPLGPGLARNLAAAQARSDILFFMDADVCLSPTTLIQVLARFDNEPQLAALIGSYDKTPAETNFLSQYRNLLHHYTHQHGNTEAGTFWGACGAIRREVFEAMGGFNAGHLEDVELGYRMREAGFRIRLDPEIQVKHLKRWQPGLMLKTDIFIRGIPWTMLILKYRHLPNDLNLRMESRVSVLLLSALSVLAVAGFFYTPSWYFGCTVAVALLLLNYRLYYFFWRLKGAGFALLVIPWHWFYYFYSAIAYALGHLYYFNNKKNS